MQYSQLVSVAMRISHQFDDIIKQKGVQVWCQLQAAIVVKVRWFGAVLFEQALSENRAVAICSFAVAVVSFANSAKIRHVARSHRNREGVERVGLCKLGQELVKCVRKKFGHSFTNSNIYIYISLPRKKTTQYTKQKYKKSKHKSTQTKSK